MFIQRGQIHDEGFEVREQDQYDETFQSERY
jgi:hypothetical protein